MKVGDLVIIGHKLSTQLGVIIGIKRCNGRIMYQVWYKQKTRSLRRSFLANRLKVINKT